MLYLLRSHYTVATSYSNDIQQYRQPNRCNNNDLLVIPISSTCFRWWFRPSSGAPERIYSLWYNLTTMWPAGSLPPRPGYRPATSWLHYTTSCNIQSSAPEDGQNHCLKHVELIGIINKLLLLHLVDCLYYSTNDTRSNKHQWHSN